MSFPQFPRLPGEMQDRIWDLCIPKILPTAYVVHVGEKPHHPNRGRPQLYLNDTVDPRSSLLVPYRAHEEALSVLRATCSRAAEAARKECRHAEPVVIHIEDRDEDEEADEADETDESLDSGSFRLQVSLKDRFWSSAVRTVSSLLHPPAPTSHAGPSARAAASAKPYRPRSISVNSRTHLIFWVNFWDGWRNDILPRYFDSRLGFQVPRYLAAPWSTGQGRDILDTCLPKLALPECSFMMQVRIFYLCVDPDQLRYHAVDVRRFNPYNTALEDEPGFEDHVHVFLSEYGSEGSCRAGPFRYGTREYYEVSADELMRKPGFAVVLCKVDLIYRRGMRERLPASAGTDWERIRFRLLTWRTVT